MPYQPRIKSFMDNVFSGSKCFYSLSDRVWNPPADVYEIEDEIFIIMEIAGVDENRLKIALEDNVLTVRGTREEATKASKQNYHLMEIHYGPFERIFRLPPGVASDDIEANYEKGFLSVRARKRKQAASAVKVNVRE